MHEWFLITGDYIEKNNDRNPSEIKIGGIESVLFLIDVDLIFDWFITGTMGIYAENK